ncbi:MAG TPA: hypothetical protein VF712_10355 [Thermoleophilaceae bacterium]|jgi:hypothetical protein
MRSSVRTSCLAIGLAVAFAAVPASAGAAGVGDYSCDLSLSVSTPMDNGSSGSFSASGPGECWLANPTVRVPTQFSASGTYRAQRCSLISIAQPSYLTLTGTLTFTPSGGSSLSTSVTIKTADVATSNSGAGTITLGSGQQGPITVDYDSGALGFVARCGGGDFQPEYDGTFVRAGA